MWLEKISYLDKILLVVLMVSVLFKIIYEIICWSIVRKYTRDKKGKSQCIYLSNKNGTQKCFFSKMTADNNYSCKKRKCSTYKTVDLTINDIKEGNKFVFFITLFINWISQLSSIILIIRTLINSL